MLLELFSCFLLIMYKYSGFFSKAQSKEQHFWLLSTPTRNGWMIQMSRPTTAAVIDALRALFSTFGLPHKIVSVNGRTFVSAEIRRFYKDNGITALSHPPSTTKHKVAKPNATWPSRRGHSPRTRQGQYSDTWRASTVENTTGQTPAAARDARDPPRSRGIQKDPNAFSPASFNRGLSGSQRP